MVRDVHHRFDAPAIIGVVGLVLGIVLLAVSFTVPWWASFANGTMTSWYLGGRCEGGTCTGYGGTVSLEGVFGLSFDLVFVAMVLGIAAVVAFGGALLWPRVGVITLVLGVVGAVLALVAPLYLYFALPGALTSYGFPVPVAGFFGSDSAGGVSYSWTGGAGWFLTWLIVPVALGGTLAGYVSTSRHVAEEKALEELDLLGTHAQEVETNSVEPEDERFCPLCGARYPASEEFCVKDSAPLKDVVP